MGRSVVLCTTKTPPESRFVAFAAMLLYSVLLPSTLQPPRLARSSVAEMFTNIYQPKNPRPLPPHALLADQCSMLGGMLPYRRAVQVLLLCNGNGLLFGIGW